ncbi:MAG: hypothetical protein ACOZAR_00415 [Patescibacteria group bacterium]
MLPENKNINAPDMQTLREITEANIDNKESVVQDFGDKRKRLEQSGDEGFKKVGNMVDDLFSEEEDEKGGIKEENYKENKIAKLDNNSYKLTPEERKMMEGWSDAEVNKFVVDANYYKEHGRTDFENYKQHLIRERNGSENRQAETGNVDTGNQNQNLESNNNNYQESGDSGMGGGTGAVEGGGGSSGGDYENKDVKVTDQGGDKVLKNSQGQERGRAIPLDDGSYNVVDKRTGKVTNILKDEKTGEYVVTDTDNGNEVGRMTEAEAKKKYGQ